MKQLRVHVLGVRVICVVAIGFALVSCKSKSQAEVAGVWVAQAEGIEALPTGKAVALVRGQLPADASDPVLGESKDVLLAIARDVRWAKIRDLSKGLVERGRVPHLIVANGRKKGSFKLRDELQGDPIKVFVSVGGKLCVAPPNSPEAKCVQRGDRSHVDRAFTRELVREAVKGYGLHDVLVDVPADLEWADVVRAVDGSRTCCFEDKVRVRLK